MKTILHLVRYDVLRLRWFVLAWIVVVALYVAAGFASVLAAGTRATGHFISWDAVTTLAAALLVVQLATPYVFAQILIMGDPLVGASAGWRTRPIAGWRLLGAKTTTALLVLVVLPVILATPWWLWCGLTSAQIGMAALQILLAVTVVVIPAAFVAALVDTLPRALVWGLLVVPVASASAGFLARANFIATDIAPLLLLAVCAGVLGTVIVQFVARSAIVRTAGVAGVIATALALLFVLDHLHFSPPDEPREAQGLSVQLLDATDRGRGSLGLDLRIVSPNGLAYQTTWGMAEWRWSQVVWRSEIKNLYANNSMSTSLFGLANIPPDPETEAWQLAKRDESRRRYPHASFQAPSGTNAIGTCDIPSGVLTRIEQDAPACNLTIQFLVGRPHRLGTFALRDTSWHASNGIGWRVEPTSNPAEFVLHDAVFDPHLFPSPHRTAEARYFLGDARSHLVGQLWMSGDLHNGLNPIFSVRTALHNGSIAQQPVVRRGKWIFLPITPPEETEITAAALEPLGVVVRHVAVDGFRVNR